MVKGTNKMNTVTINEVNAAFKEMYGEEEFNKSEFSDFDTAFLSAWESFDFLSGSEELEPTEYDCAIVMCDMWQFSY